MEASMRPVYPHTPKVDHVHWYHGVPIPDPYAWLEEMDTAPVKEWISAQNAVTASHLSKLPLRGSLRRRFQELLSYPRYYDLVERDGYLLFKRNDGLQHQLVVCMCSGPGKKPRFSSIPATTHPTARLGLRL
jgi:prolyl oligopeptidase